MLAVRPDTPLPGQERVWHFPRAAVAATIWIDLGGTGTTATPRAVRTLEASPTPGCFVPPDDIAPGVLMPTHGSSACAWKEDARADNAAGGDERRTRTAWPYPDPSPALAMLRDHDAVSAAAMDAYFVDKERVAPQPGNLIDRWMTSGEAGPFHGAPGSRFW